MSKSSLSQLTQRNWWIACTLLFSGLAVSISSVYFLYIPSGGFQGGRNPFHDLQIVFSRHTWKDLHTWSGVILISTAIIHLALHWNWVKSMTRRTWNELFNKCGCLNPKGRWNLILNYSVALSFLLTAISGIYFLFVPGGRWANDPIFLFPRFTWDTIHTWAGVFFITSGMLHIVIHWKWITKVTRQMIEMIFLQPFAPHIASTNNS